MSANKNCKQLKLTFNKLLQEKQEFDSLFNEINALRPNISKNLIEVNEKITEIKKIRSQIEDEVFGMIYDLEDNSDKTEAVIAKYGSKIFTRIKQKEVDKKELNKTELILIYDVKGKIIPSFSSEEKRIVKEIIGARNTKADLAMIIGCTPEKISISEAEALQGGIRYHYGDIDLGDLTSAKGLSLPQIVGGDLNLSGLTSAEGLVLPQSVEKGLYLRSLTSVKGLVFPQRVGEYLDLNGLTKAEGLNLPLSVGGHLDLDGLTSAEGLNLPQSVGGSLKLEGLTCGKELILPKSVGVNLRLDGLTSAEGLTLPQNVGEDIYLRCLTSAEGLTLPQSLGGEIWLDSLPDHDKSYLRNKYPHLAEKIK